MSNVSKLLATDETFREVADILFGGGADDLIHKMSPDGADLSAGAKRRKREKTEAKIGLATNYVGLAAGAAATPPAFKALGDARYKAKHGTERPASAPGPLKTKMGTLKPVKAYKKLASSKKGAVALAGGAAALQVGNLAGDAIANRVLGRSAKKDPNVKGGARTAARVANKTVKDQIHKGYLVPITKSLNTAKDIPEAAQGAKKGGKATLAPMPTKRGVGDGNKFSAGHFKALPGKIKGGKGAPVKKNNDVLDVVWEGEISKMNEDKRQVFGWASIVELNGEKVVDLQGDYISIDEVEKSAYEYVHKSRKGGDMHLRDNLDGADRVVHKSDMIESMVVTPEKKKALGLPESAPTGWWVGYQVNDDELWNKVKSGERTGFSIHGRGVRTPM